MSLQVQAEPDSNIPLAEFDEFEEFDGTDAWWREVTVSSYFLKFCAGPCGGGKTPWWQHETMGNFFLKF